MLNPQRRVQYGSVPADMDPSGNTLEKPGNTLAKSGKTLEKDWKHFGKDWEHSGNRLENSGNTLESLWKTFGGTLVSYWKRSGRSSLRTAGWFGKGLGLSAALFGTTLEQREEQCEARNGVRAKAVIFFGTHTSRSGLRDVQLLSQAKLWDSLGGAGKTTGRGW